MKLIYWHKSLCFFCDPPSSEATPLQASLRFLRFVFFFLLPPLLSVVFLHPSPSPFPFYTSMLLGLTVHAAVFIENEHFSHQRCLCGSFKSALIKWRKLPQHVRRPMHAKHRWWVWRCKHLAEIKVRHKTCSWSERWLRFRGLSLVGVSLHFSVSPPSRHPLHDAQEAN